jgi:hypothetical protein
MRVTVVPQCGQVPILAQWPERSMARLVARSSTAQWHW